MSCHLVCYELAFSALHFQDMPPILEIKYRKYIIIMSIFVLNYYVKYVLFCLNKVLFHTNIV